MSLLAFLVLTQTVTPKAVFDRYAAFRSAHPVISADWSVARGSQGIAHGTIALDGSKRMLFKATNGTLSYTLSETERGGIELLPSTQTYDEFPAERSIGIPASRIGQQSSFVPAILLRTQIFNPKIKYKSEPSITVGGVTVDVVSWEVATQEMTYKFEVAVDPEGRVVQYSRANTKGGMQMMPNHGPGAGRPGSAPHAAAPSSGGPSSAAAPSSKVVWTLSNYRWNLASSLTAFYTPLPKGYVPYAIPTASSVALGVDDQFPSTPWKSGGKMVDLKSAVAGKPALIVITSPDSAPSQAAVSNVDSLKAGIPGTQVAIVSLSRTAAGAKGLPFDATGKAAQAIGDTSTPLFVLIDANGKITNLWTGFDRDEESLFVKEVQGAIKTVLETPATPATGRTPSKSTSIR